MANTFTSLTYHIVFSTKNRKPKIRKEFESDLYRYIAGIIRENNGQLLEIGGVDDHIHILTGIRPTIAVSDLVRLIKANSSKWIKEEYANPFHPFGWQTGYSAFTVSESQCEFVREYIRHQKKHHRKVSFRDEYLALLQKHKIEYDEQFVFDEENVA